MKNNIPYPFTERSLEEHDNIPMLNNGVYMLYGSSPVGLHDDFKNNNCLYGILICQCININGTMYRKIDVTATDALQTKCISKFGFANKGEIIWS